MKAARLRAALRREGARLGSAAEFLTRLPLPPAGWEEGRLRFALSWFPLIGLGLGLAQGLALAGAVLILPPAVAAGLAVALGLWLTGALHEDGLADTADGLGGAGTPRERALEIMRDSRLGTYGAAALVVALGLRWASFASLAAVPADAVAAVAAAGLLSRTVLLALARLPIAREGSLGGMLAVPEGTALTAREATAACASAALGLALLGWGPFLLALTAASVTTVLLAGIAFRRLGGMTGDIYGATIVSAELAVLVALLAGLG
ncbi:MAG: adenosylcobinamide-GDP ribazoletransferase [Pseudomonadota bacterium]